MKFWGFVLASQVLQFGVNNVWKFLKPGMRWQLGNALSLPILASFRTTLKRRQVNRQVCMFGYCDLAFEAADDLPRKRCHLYTISLSGTFALTRHLQKS